MDEDDFPVTREHERRVQTPHRVGEGRCLAAGSPGGVGSLN